MKRIFFKSVILFMLSCCSIGRTPEHKSEYCKEFYDLVKEEWIDYGTYYFYESQPEYLFSLTLRRKYFPESCIIALHESDIVRLLGNYHKEIDIGYGRIKKVYYLNEERSHSWDMYVDSTGHVREVYLSPVVIDID